MPSTFQQAGQEVRDLGKLLITKFHQELAEAEVKIDYVFAFAELDEQSEPTGPAITHGGRAVLGLASRTKLKDRVKGLADGEILLDGDAWPKFTYAQKLAVLDHEMEHFQVKRDKLGAPLTDDIDRPLLTIRPHDREHGWFDIIAQRHGIHSVEVTQFRQTLLEAPQAYAGHITLADSLETTAHAPARELLDMEPVAGSGDFIRVPEKTMKKLVPKREQEAGTVMTVSVNGGPEREMDSEELIQDMTKMFRAKDAENAKGDEESTNQ